MKTCYPLLFAICSLLYACGFSPVYSDNSKLQNKLTNIYIAPIAGTNGIDLRNHLLLAWNTDNREASKYKLSVKLGEPVTTYKALQRSGDATWEEVKITASWTLSEGQKTILRSSDSASESYAFVSDLISANASKATAIQNTIKIIGDRIEFKVNAKLKNTDFFF